jgi:hypothetical protein
VDTSEIFAAIRLVRKGIIDRAVTSQGFDSAKTGKCLFRSLQELQVDDGSSHQSVRSLVAFNLLRLSFRPPSR